MKYPLLIAMAGMLLAESGDVLLVNSGTAKWQAESGGSESMVLREDAQTGALELFARYPPGHVFPPHWHSVNERIVLLEGQLSISVGGSRTTLDPGGFAYLPAKQVQTMTCVSKSRCGFYVSWDGHLDFHKADR
jgi:quercetin dioxygenase-like cupin family protein